MSLWKKALLEDLFEETKYVREDSDVPPEPLYADVEEISIKQAQAEPTLHINKDRGAKQHNDNKGSGSSRDSGCHNPGKKKSKPIIDDDEEKELSDEERKKAKQAHCEKNPYHVDLTGECKKPEDKKPPQGSNEWIKQPNGTFKNIKTGKCRDAKGRPISCK